MMSTFPKFWTCLAFEIIETKNHWKKKIEKVVGWIPCSGKSSKRGRSIDEKLSGTCSVSTSGMYCSLERCSINHMFSVMVYDEILESPKL